MRFEIILNIMKLTRCGVVLKQSNLHLHPHYYANPIDNPPTSFNYQYFLPIFYPTTDNIMHSFINGIKAPLICK